jgi:hypothetical protein
MRYCEVHKAAFQVLALDFVGIALAFPTIDALDQVPVGTGALAFTVVRFQIDLPRRLAECVARSKIAVALTFDGRYWPSST